MLLFDIFGKTHKLAEQKDLESIKVGGRNLLFESSFRTDISPANTNWGIITVNDIAYREWTKDGFHYKTIETSQASNSSCAIQFNINAMGLNPGDEITISCDIKGSFGNSNSGLCFMHSSLTSSAFYAKVYPGDPHPNFYEDWTRVSRTFTIPNEIGETASGAKYLYLLFGGGCFGRTADVWVRDVQLEKGNMCTDYAPAYQDILRRIQLLESAILGGGVKFYHHHLRLGVL